MTTKYTHQDGNVLTAPRFQAAERPGLEKKGGGGHDGGMDDVLRRVAALEGDVKDIKATLGRFEPMLVRIDERVKDMPSAKEFGEVKGRVMQLPTGESFGELKGKLAQVPNWWQLFLFIFTAVGGAVFLAKFIH
jgi:hypothetical protein